MVNFEAVLCNKEALLPHAVMQWYCSVWGRRPGSRGGGFTEAIMLITPRRGNMGPSVQHVGVDTTPHHATSEGIFADLSDPLVFLGS